MQNKVYGAKQMNALKRPLNTYMRVYTSHGKYFGMKLTIM